MWRIKHTSYRLKFTNPEHLFIKLIGKENPLFQLFLQETTGRHIK